MKKDTKDIFKAWGWILAWILVVVICLYLSGCSIIEKGARTELNEHIDKRATLVVTSELEKFKSGKGAREITQNGLEQIADDCIVKSIGFGFAGVASWIAAFFGLRYRKEVKKNNKGDA